MRPLPPTFLLLAVALLAGCGHKNDEVPFGLPGKGGKPAPNAAPGAPPPVVDDDSDVAPPAGTRSVAVEGANLTATLGEIRVLRTFDADGDGDRDALLLADNGGEGHLFFAKRDGAAFIMGKELTTTAPDAVGCTLGGARIDALGTAFFWVHFDRVCAGEATAVHWIVSREASPRMRESLEFLPPAGDGDATVALTWTAADHDKDGHEDVVADVALSLGPAQVHVPLTWLDRTAGLARDTTEPNATLRKLVEGARATAGDTAQSAALLRATVTTLCAGARPGPRLRVGTTMGLGCDTALLDQSKTLLALALAKQGRIAEALDAWSDLDLPSRNASRDAMRTALAPALDTTVYETIDGAPISPQVLPPAHLPAVGFESASTLVIRGSETVLYDMTDKSSVDAYTTGAALVKDPQGQRVAMDVIRLCDGYHVIVAKTHEVMEGVLVGKPLATPLLEAKPSPEGSCSPTYPATGHDDGGYQLVGWAPQGIVAARPGSVRIVSLDASNNATAPVVLASETPLPAPLPSGLSNRAGTFLILPSEFGLLWQSRGPNPRAKLILPPIWAGGVPRDVAVSEDGQSFAFVRGDHVAVLRPPPPPPDEH